MAGRCKATLGACVLLFLHSPPAKADIWGFVDAERMPHFAASQLDERYELLLRDSQAVEPFRRMQVPGKVQDDAPEMNPADYALAFTGAGGASAALSRTLAFLEQSSNYRAVRPLLREASKTHGIDYSLLKALIATESGFNPYAVSPKGAVGLMQLIPPTAKRYGVTAGKGSTVEKKLTDPKTNIKAGARYLADLIRMFPGRLDLALAAYNAGEGAVQRAGNRIPNYPETRNYVKTVLQLYSGLAPAAVKAPTGPMGADIKDGSAEGSRKPQPAGSILSLSRADALPD